MPNFKGLPTSVRYLVARLRHWAQPTVWAPLTVLCAGGLFIWEVTLHPERLSIDGEEVATSNNPASLPGLSAEDTAIAAEIDSSPALVNQFNRSNSEQDFLNSSVVKDKGLFNEISARRSETRQPSSPLKQPLQNLANSAIYAANNNPENSSLPTSKTTSDSSLSGDGGLIYGIKTIVGESGSTATATSSQQSNGATSGKQNENPLPLSPLQAAMKKYVAPNTSATAATQKTTSSSQLLDRPASTQAPANLANLLPTAATAQAGSNPANVPAALPSLPAPTNTIINESQQFLNPAATAPEAFSGLNSRVPSLPEINARPATVALPKNPYQTNLSNFGLAPGAASGIAPIATPSPIPLIPSPIPNGIGGSRIISPQFSPNSANSQFQPAQRSQLNLPIQPSFGAVPQNTNQGVGPQPQPFSTPRSLTPGRYLGGGEINTFGNP